MKSVPALHLGGRGVEWQLCWVLPAAVSHTAGVGDVSNTQLYLWNSTAVSGTARVT